MSRVGRTQQQQCRHALNIFAQYAKWNSQRQKAGIAVRKSFSVLFFRKKSFDSLAGNWSTDIVRSRTMPQEFSVNMTTGAGKRVYSKMRNNKPQVTYFYSFRSMICIYLTAQLPRSIDPFAQESCVFLGSVHSYTITMLPL